MSLSTTDFRQACGQFATGIAVLTTATPEGETAGLTINSFVSLSLNPPLVMAAVAHNSSQLATFDAGGVYAINILSDLQKDLSAHFAQVTGERFVNVPWQAGVTGAPILEGVIAVIECRIVERFDAGDHRVLIGEPVEARVLEGRPLLYYGSGYRVIGA